MTARLENFWDTFRRQDAPRPAVAGTMDADVCIVGGGFSGLWTAYWLTFFDPGLDVVVIEADRVGAGASGRNAGWLSMKLPGSTELLQSGPHGREGLLALQQAGIAAVDDVIAIMNANGVDIDAHRGGYLQIAQTPVEMTRLKAVLANGRARGLGEDDLRMIGPDELCDRVRPSNPQGALFSPHCARINPRKLVDGLARSVEARGVRIFERSTATDIGAKVVKLADGEIRAPFVVVATEGHTVGLGSKMIAVQAGLAATAPLSPSDWDRIGWSGRECMAGAARGNFYAQRTADDRIVFGCGSMPYRFQPHARHYPGLPDGLEKTYRKGLQDLFPEIRTDFTHIWSGSVGVTRDWTPSIVLDRQQGLGMVGGFAGQGVATTYLGGRSMAAMLLDRKADVALTFGWVGRSAANWPPEPLRWIGAHLSEAAYRIAQAQEKGRSDGRPSWLGEITDRIVGG